MFNLLHMNILEIKCPTLGKQCNKLWYTHEMEFNTAMSSEQQNVNGQGHETEGRLQNKSVIRTV